jgi:hypothetical protein
MCRPIIIKPKYFSAPVSQRDDLLLVVVQSQFAFDSETECSPLLADQERDA